MNVLCEKEFIDEYYNFEKLIHFVLNKKFHIHEHYKVYKESYEDLFTIGKIGLIQAIKRYDESLGYTKSTFYVNCITHEICRQFQIYGYEKRKLDFESISLNSKSSEDDDEIIELIGKEDVSFLKVNNKEYIDDLIRKTQLTHREEEIIRIKLNNPYLLNREIGEILNTTEGLVSQIIIKALNKINKTRETIENKTNHEQNIIFYKTKVKSYRLYDTYLKQVLLEAPMKQINIEYLPDMKITYLYQYCRKKVHIKCRYFLFKEDENIDEFLNNRGGKNRR